MPDVSRPFTGLHIPGSERLRVAIMGVVLAALVYGVFFYRPATPPPQVSPVITDQTPVPTLDTVLLDTVRDATRLERLTVEKEPLAHLLEKSMMVVPAVARALGMPTEPMPFHVLRADPQKSAAAIFGTRARWSRSRPVAMVIRSRAIRSTSRA
jgi:hypothetical protein